MEDSNSNLVVRIKRPRPADFETEHPNAKRPRAAPSDYTDIVTYDHLPNRPRIETDQIVAPQNPNRAADRSSSPQPPRITRSLPHISPQPSSKIPIHDLLRLTFHSPRIRIRHWPLDPWPSHLKDYDLYTCVVHPSFPIAIARMFSTYFHRKVREPADLPYDGIDCHNPPQREVNVVGGDRAAIRLVLEWLENYCEGNTDISPLKVSMVGPWPPLISLCRVRHAAEVLGIGVMMPYIGAEIEKHSMKLG